jgi:glycerol-3-phosphate acyltransferase PlsY
MHLAVLYVIVFLCSYVVGSIPFSWIVTKLKTGLDLRQVGSGNVGGRNVYRATKSKKWAWFAGFLDVSRSVTAVAVPFFISKIYYFNPLFLENAAFKEPLTSFFPDTILCFSLAVAGLGAILGHNWPLYLLSSGGRGITVVLASMLVANPLIIAFWIFLWPVVITLVGYSSIAYVVTTILCGVIALFLPSVIMMPWAQCNLAIAVLLFTIALVMLSRQRDNFRKIREGEAKKMKIWKALGGKKKMSEEILK